MHECHTYEGVTHTHTVHLSHTQRCHTDQGVTYTEVSHTSAIHTHTAVRHTHGASCALSWVLQRYTHLRMCHTDLDVSYMLGCIT